MESLRDEGGGNRGNANEAPFLLRVFDEFTDDERGEYTCGSYPVAYLIGDRFGPARGSPVMFLVLPFPRLGLAGHGGGLWQVCAT